MKLYKLRREQWIPRPLPEVFEFFSRPENLKKITPPWMKFRIVTPRPIRIEPGARIAYTLRVWGIPLKWLTEIERWNPPFEFIHVQAKGPYRLRRHTHRFFVHESGTTIMDDVEYGLPFGLFGRLAHFQVARDVAEIFDYRERQVKRLIA